MKPVQLLLTAGEPAGIGPELCLQWAMAERTEQLLLVGDLALMAARARLLKLPIELQNWTPGDAICCKAGQLSVWSVVQFADQTPGILSVDNAPAVLQSLQLAAQACLDGHFDGMVTAPVHKGIINDAGIPFSGHTEFLQALCGVEQVVMMLATEGLRVALVTTHLPLREVADAITRARLLRVSRILHADLQRYFGCKQPRILVAGLNPHAGEGGHLGHEEIAVITPALDSLRAEGLQLIGPLPADTLFTPHQLATADAVLAMYHDQGLPVLKYKGFGAAVNITLGLPIIRTSVDHGTALDLAGTGQADGGSLLTAIRVATSMALCRRQFVLA